MVELRFWVEPLDDVDALGDYGGYTFDTEEEAEAFVATYYREHADGVASGYYEEDAEPSLLVIETLSVLDRRTVEP